MSKTIAVSTSFAVPYLFTICAIVLSVFGSLLCGSAAIASSFTGRVVGVTDGDTIKVMHNGEAINIRLAEIDCPEKSQAFGAQAKQFTSALCFNRELRIVEVSHDRYGRTVAMVYLSDGECLNETLVSKGFAWCYRKYCKRPEVIRLEEQARMEHLGLWRDPAAIEPAQFRQEQRALHAHHPHNVPLT